jgi:nicotinamidase-related amidase
MQTDLLLVDIQKDYFPGGRMELEGSPEASGRAKELLSHGDRTSRPSSSTCRSWQH